MEAEKAFFFQQLRNVTGIWPFNIEAARFQYLCGVSENLDGNQCDGKQSADPASEG